MCSKASIPGTGVILLLILSSAFCGCPVTPKPIIDDSGNEAGEILERSDLFVAGTISGEILFWTNDTRYWSPVGYTVWGLSGSSQSLFRERRVVCTKISGHDVAGYGIIFCHHDETNLVVMINTLSEYIIGEIVGGRFYSLTPWTETPYLSSGYNQENRIDVSCNGEEFILSLNDHQITVFTDEEVPLHPGGEDGYIVVISPLEQFPEVPVEVRFLDY